MSSSHKIGKVNLTYNSLFSLCYTANQRVCTCDGAGNDGEQVKMYLTELYNYPLSRNFALVMVGDW